MKKLSYYNFYFKTDKGEPVVYNARSNTSLKLLPRTDLEQQLIKQEMIIDESLNELALYEFDALRHRYCNKTLWINIATTMKCNFQCSYCYNQSHPPITMNLKTAKRLVYFVEQNIQNIQDLYIWWLGGEPTLELDIFSYLSQHFIALTQRYHKGYFTHYYTNGYLLNDSICQFLKDHGVAKLSITLDGPRESHNLRRYTKTDHCTYDTIIKNTALAQKYFSDIALRINVDKRNVTDVLQVLEDIHKANIDPQRVHPYLGNVIVMEDESHLADYCMDNNEFAHATFQFEQSAAKYGYYDYTCARYLYSHRHHFCMADILNSFTIDPLGNLARCNKEFDNPKFFTGTIFDDQLERNQVHINYLTNTPFKDATCSKCKFLPICSGGCRRRLQAPRRFRCTLAKYILPELLASELQETSLTKVNSNDIHQLSIYQPYHFD